MASDSERINRSAWKIIPQFDCADARKAADFYVQDLHFKLGGLNLAEDGESGSMCSVAMGKKADANIYLFENKSSTPSAAMIALGEEDLDAYYTLLQNEGRVTISQPIKDQPWGYRQFQITDPDGNTIQFFKFLEGGNPGTE